MREIGFKPLVDEKYQSPIITSFIYPEEWFDFEQLYNELKRMDLLYIQVKFQK